MRIITKKKIREFTALHSDAASPAERWITIIENCEAQTFNELRQTFPTADKVERKTVFNIGGLGKGYRLITRIDYYGQKVYILRTLTHDEYLKGGWK
ncbi:MAG: type II toxin-antitoxin system HigB family toxin [bacterium]|nr:type II toxin-antitoxin system HigB family toxin [bacterium]